MVQKTQDEAAVLLCEVEVGPYQVKPWSFGRFQKVFPALMGSLLPALRALGLTVDNFEEIWRTRGPELIGAALPAFGPLIAATLEITEEEVAALDYDLALALGVTILSQNIERLKNSLPLIMGQIQGMIRAT